MDKNKDIIKYNDLTEADIDSYLDYDYLYSDEEEFLNRQTLTSLVSVFFFFLLFY